MMVWGAVLYMLDIQCRWVVLHLPMLSARFNVGYFQLDSLYHQADLRKRRILGMKDIEEIEGRHP
jgi:hypothetical protein